MPLIYSCYCFPEGGKLVGIVDLSGLVYEANTIVEAKKYIGCVKSGLVYAGGLSGEGGHYRGYVRGGVYKGGFMGEGGKPVAKIFQSFYMGSEIYTLCRWGGGEDASPMIGYMTEPAGDIFNPINIVHAGAAFLLLLDK